jgi:hypothetical protein
MEHMIKQHHLTPGKGASYLHKRPTKLFREKLSSLFLRGQNSHSTWSERRSSFEEVIHPKWKQRRILSSRTPNVKGRSTREKSTTYQTNILSIGN